MNAREDGSLSMELGGILLPLTRSSGRFRAIWGRHCTREQGHAFWNATNVRRRHDIVRGEG